MALVRTSAVPNYFDEMLKYIRDIRASERRVYLRCESLQANKKQNPAVTRGFSVGYEYY